MHSIELTLTLSTKMKISSLLAFALGVFLVGCSNQTSITSSGSGNTNTLNKTESVESVSGSQINMIYDEPVVAGQPHTFYFQLRPQGATPGETTGTVHWGDNSSSRIRDDHTMAIPHTWASEGAYDIAVQIDGEAKAVVTRGLGVSAAGTSSASSAQTNLFAGFTCSPASGTPISSGAFTEFIFASGDPIGTLFPSVTVNLGTQCETPITRSIRITPATALHFLGPPHMCNVGDIYTVVMQTSTPGPGFASCSWPIAHP